MNKRDKDRVIEYYSQCLKDFGPSSAQSLDWTSQYTQTVRFAVLEKIAELEGKSILDVGSGLGDLLPFLRRTGKNFKYLGIDIMPEFVSMAKQKYGENLFELTEVENINNKFDFVFASGSLTYNVENYKNFYFSMIKKMFSLANTALGFNMLNIRSFRISEDCVAYEPEEVIEFCRTITPKAALITGYLKKDFTIFMYK
jgi:SAM-dependent methyltransferase